MFCLTCWRRKIVDTENEKQEDENNHITEAEGQTEVYYNVQREFTSRHPQPQQDNEYSEVHREVTEDCESEYADANAIFGLNSHEVVTMATYSVVRPLSERHVKVKQAQTIGEDGTLYTGVSHPSVGSMKANCLKSKLSYSRSEYASIDHMLKPLPAPPKTKLKTKQRSYDSQ